MQQGTPWWITAILMMLTALLSNQLTVRRERAKATSDWLVGWRNRFSSALVAICDSASLHYSEADNVKNTLSSSCLITNSLKRIGQLRSEVEFVDSANAKRFRDAYLNLHYVITGSKDFEDANRAVRLPKDAIFNAIRDVEDALIKISREKLRPKSE
jgi:hypothetical protein